VRGEALSLVIHRQAALRAAGRPGAGGAHRTNEKAGAQRVHGIPVTARDHHVETGRGKIDPRRDRPGSFNDCDPRIIGKHYGKRIWQSLPPMKRTRDEAVAVGFFNAPVSASSMLSE